MMRAGMKTKRPNSLKSCKADRMATSMDHSERKALEFVDRITKRIKVFFKWMFNTRIGGLFKSAVQLVLCAVVFFFVFQLLGSFHFFDKNSTQDSVLSDTSDSSSSTDENCNVVGINLHGMILTYVPNHADSDPLFNYDVTSSEAVTWAVRQANDDEKIKAVLIEIDSGGGLPVAGEEIANSLKNSSKPTVAVIRQTGASAAYWAASGAGKIFASGNSDIGSIGVTSSYLDETTKNKKDGYQYIPLTSGEFKDTGNPNKPVTQADKDLIMRDLKIVYGNFIDAVSKNRNIPIAKVQALADGSTVLGVKAKEDGLIDEIGGMPEAETYLEKTIGSKPDICWQ